MENHQSAIQRLKRETFNRAWETQAYVRFFLHSRRAAAKRRFILVTRARSGSHLLMNMLNTHPDIHVDNESVVLGYRKNILFPRQYIDGLSARTDRPVYGCKVNLVKLSDHHLTQEAFFEDFHRDGWLFIHLLRQNVYRQTISSLIARHRQVFHDRKANALSDFSLEVDIQEMLAIMDLRFERTAIEKSLLSGYPYLEVVYERDLLGGEKHQVTMDRVFTFLGLPSVPIKADLVKTAPRDLSTIISNYDQVIEAVRTSRYAALLEQD